MEYIEDSGERISREALVEFENRSGLELPYSYKEFLLKNNGGRPVPDNFLVPDWSGHSSVANVQIFYRLKDKRTSSSEIEWNLHVFEGRIPGKLLPIGNTDYGDVICISCAGNDKGAIYLWDHEGHQGNNVYLISDDFSKFVDGLFHYVDPDETESEGIIRTHDVEALRRLLESGYDVEKVDKYGRTLIEEAAIQNRPEIIRLLFEHGASLRNALALAKDNLEFFPDHQASVDLLKKFSGK